MSCPLICTIASNNYLHFVRVLAKSFLKVHPDGRVAVLIADRRSPQVDYEEEPFETHFIEDLDLPGFRSMAFRYSILELNTAVKPAFLEFIRDRGGAEKVLYFDPDILVTAPLGDLYELLDNQDILLTPHFEGPPEDDRHPSEKDILHAGIYNMGFLGIALNERTRPFLRWWAERLRTQCVNNIKEGFFTDQKWMDLTPAYMPRTQILHGPQYNMAYWNLHRRRLEERGGNWLVNGHPLRFFHFSGFAPDNIEIISRHQDRYRLSDRPDLRALFQQYAARLETERAGKASISYAWEGFDDGTPIPDFCRRILQDLDVEGRRWPNPFDSLDPDGFYNWLLETVPGVPSLPRVALALWEREPICRAAFSLEDDSQWHSFAHWYMTTGAEIFRIPDAFTEPVRAMLRDPLKTVGKEPSSAGLQVTRATALERVLSSNEASAGLADWCRSLGDRADFWLATDASLGQGRPLISRLALALHRHRTDLGESYPQPLGASRPAFALWFATHAGREYKLPKAAIAPVLSSLPLPDRLRAELWRVLKRPPGIQKGSVSCSPVAAPHTGKAGSSLRFGPGASVVGYLKAPSGKGQEARGTAQALMAAGYPCRTCPVDEKTQRLQSGIEGLWDAEAGQPNGPLHPADGRPAGVAAPPLESREFPFAALLHVNADMTPHVMAALPNDLREAPIRIGYWDWELSHFPSDFWTAFESLTEVWAPSRFCRDAYATLSPVPVRHVPPCVPAPSAPHPDKTSFGIAEDTFLFVNAFSVRSVVQRKNPEALIEAFALLQRGCERKTQLLIKVQHAGEKLMERLRLLADGLPVTFVTDSLSAEEMSILMSSCDCYVSLHRSEGLGLPLVEAMYLNKPVIATGYSGNQDFLDRETGWPVDYRMVRVGAGAFPYPEIAVWADPDPEHAAACMREVVSDASAVARKTEAAAKRVRETYTPDAAGARFVRELERLQSEMGLMAQGRRLSATRSSAAAKLS